MNDPHTIGVRALCHRDHLLDNPAAIAGAIAVVRAMLADDRDSPINWHHVDCILATAEATAAALHRRMCDVLSTEVTEWEDPE